MLGRKAGKVMPQLYNPIHPLPPAFAQHILDVEMQFEDNRTVTLLNTLLTLYSVGYKQTAIEYYEALNDPKYFQFKERMHALLNRKEVLKLLSPTVNSGGPAAPEPQEEAVPKLNPDKRCRSVPGRDAEPTLLQSRSIDGIVTGSHSEAKIAVKNVHADIVRQHDSMQQRLKERSKTRSISRPISPITPCNSYEQELEEILERHLIEKQAQLAGVRRQFEGQIAEIEVLARKSNNGLLEKVVREMKKAQETATARVEAELFAKKQEEVNALRRKWMKA